MSASNEMKRYVFGGNVAAYEVGSLTPANEILFGDRNPDFVLASEADAALLAKDEVIEGLRKDAERLDWLIVGDGAKKSARVMGSDERGWSVCDCSSGLTFMSRNFPTYRTAIDAAMAKP